MNGQIDLSGIWNLTWSDGMHGDTRNPHSQPTDLHRYLKVAVPQEIHLALEQQGLIDELNLGMNTLKARWVEEQFWQYQTVFCAPSEALTGTAWLLFEQLDLVATIVLNGQIVGRHANAYRPCRIEITGHLQEGENTLVVLLDSGLHDVADREGVAYGTDLGTALNKRHWLRKPQYQFGWDWNHRLVNVGITGPVQLEWADSVRLDQVVIWAEPDAEYQQAKLTVRAFLEGNQEKQVTVRIRIQETGQQVSLPFQVLPGLHKFETTLVLDQPRLWWPVGQGEQDMYSVTLQVEVDGTVLESINRRVGVRKIEISCLPHPETGEYCILKVNGRSVFCKGGNWVPADLIYSAVGPERIRELLDLALDANFNFLRIWGGGCLPGHDMLALCDELGLMVWQDLPFACSKYPGDNPAFLAEVRAETTWMMREFASHPSLVVWCGNNELEWGAFGWGFDRTGKSLPDYALFHHVIPVIHRQEDPARPYWPSSPFSPGYQFPNEPTLGDQHPWGVSLGEDGVNFWAYRRYVDRLPNEGGVLGASSPATLRQFLPETQQEMRSFGWEHHDNAMSFLSDKLGIAYRMVEYWLGRSVEKMSLEEYVFASALLQAEGLTEYISNYRRRMFSSASAVFWMYNDSWPVTHGWTIVDYYRRKKLAYHPVRRSFQPVTVVVAEEQEELIVFGVNDGTTDWHGTLRYGCFALAGGLPIDQETTVMLPANSSTILARLDKEQLLQLGSKRHGAFALLRNGDQVLAQHRLFLEPFMDLQLVPSPPIEKHQIGEEWIFQSPVFVWGVTLDLDGESSVADDCFDLLPGIPHVVPGEQPGKLLVQRTGNDLL